MLPRASFPKTSHISERGLGITSLVARASARADELIAEQLITGAEALSSASNASLQQW
jgi:TDG/mug DNA glycosylase family protein